MNVVITSPTEIAYASSKRKMEIYKINLNFYRNYHYTKNNKIKKMYMNMMEPQLKGVRFNNPIDIIFRLQKKDKRRLDRSNILSIVEKYFCDALVHHGCIDDDNDNFIRRTIYETGRTNNEDQHVEIIITEFR